MRAVILAAGSGSRLRPVLGPWPKCLASLGGRPLVEWQMRHLREHAIRAITLVLGYRKEAIEAVCGRDVEVVYNPDHAMTNSLYSLWLARNLLSEGFVVLNSDVLFHPHLLTRLLASSHEDALLMAAREPGIRYSDEEMKIHVRDGRVAAIDKALPDAHSDGENVGIVKFGAEGAAVLVDEVNTLIEQGAVRDWLPRAFHAFCRKRPLHVIDTAGLPWIEIDFPADYARACSEVLPAILATGAVPAHPPRLADDAVSTIFGRMFHRV
jgi:L-glutamine-phosphate cytidylyltransferase